MPDADYDAGVEPLQECERCRVMCAPGMACVNSQPGHPDAERPCRPEVPMPDAEKDALVAVLAEPLRDMLETRFPAWANDSGGYRYVEFIDRVAGIAAEAGVRVTSPDGGRA